MGERWSIAFSDDIRGDIFLDFLTPRDDDRGTAFHAASPIQVGVFGCSLTFNPTSVICYKLIFVHLQTDGASFREKKAHSIQGGERV